MTESRGDRPARVGERIREELMNLLLSGDVKDPGARGAVVHGVDVSPDLRHARVYVRLSEPDADAKRRRRLLGALERASGFLRKQVSVRLGIRYSPELTFVWDDTEERAARIEELLRDVRHEPESEEP